VDAEIDERLFEIKKLLSDIESNQHDILWNLRGRRQVAEERGMVSFLTTVAAALDTLAHAHFAYVLGFLAILLGGIALKDRIPTEALPTGVAGEIVRWAFVAVCGGLMLFFARGGFRLRDKRKRVEKKLGAAKITADEIEALVEETTKKLEELRATRFAERVAPKIPTNDSDPNLFESGT